MTSLPTEAEWEYACRAGTNTPFSFGEKIAPEQVNYNGNLPYAGGKHGEGRGKTVAVKSLPVNPWGLYEMHGNVWEYCSDRFGDYSEGLAVDPTGPYRRCNCVLYTSIHKMMVAVYVLQICLKHRQGK